ncbi:MspA family porin [Rhodococcus tibetensis]|uniref:MspA family porin n=1 Tax=Rhodococcus tibetensis TaxID=2965064 RepID=UPI0035AC1BE8
MGVSVSASGPGVNAGLSGTVGPIFSTTIKPGQIVDIPLGDKPLSGRAASSRVTDLHVAVDACGGPATMRLIAVTSVSSPSADDRVTCTPRFSTSSH